MRESGPPARQPEGTRRLTEAPDLFRPSRDGTGNPTTERLDALREEQDVEKKRKKIEGQIKSLPEVSEVDKSLETVSDLRTLNLKTLIALENKYEGILQYAFTDAVGQKQKLDFKNWKGYEELRPGQKLKVNFRGNREAEEQLGAADFLPPYVRKIKVYEGGQKGQVRVSERRIGLKGQNKPPNGFYDKYGYIPVYSGDVIEIAEPDEAFDERRFRLHGSSLGDKPGAVGERPNGQAGDKTNGMAGGRPLLTEESYKKYDETEGARDREFLARLAQKTPGAPTSKIYPPQKLEEISRSIEGSGIGRSIAQLAIEFVRDPEKNLNGSCCWDWCYKVYKSLGAFPQRVYQDLNYSGKDCGTHHAQDWQMNALSGGDWLYVNNKNQYDRRGCHSVIFLDWIDQGARVARCVSQPRSGRPPRIHLVNFNNSPITHISKPGQRTNLRMA